MEDNSEGRAITVQSQSDKYTDALSCAPIVFRLLLFGDDQSEPSEWDRTSSDTGDDLKELKSVRKFRFRKHHGSKGVSCAQHEKKHQGTGAPTGTLKTRPHHDTSRRNETNVLAIKVKRLLSRLHCASGIASRDGDPFNAIFCASIQSASGGALIVVMTSCSVIIVCRSVAIMIISMLRVISTLRGSRPLAVDSALPINPLPI